MGPMMQISEKAIIFMGVSAALCFFTPFLLVIVFKLKTKASIVPTLIGAITFIVFALVLEQISHMLFLVIESPVSNFIRKNAVAYGIYGGLAAGIFEETGRLLAFIFLIKRYKNKATPIMYGIGHGGIEAIILGGLSLFSTMLTSITINAVGIDSFMQSLPEASRATMQATYEAIVGNPDYMYLITYGERISAMILHIALSVLVYIAVKDRSKRYLFPLAIFLHAFVNFFAGLYQAGVLTNILLLEVLIFLYSISVAYYAYRLYGHLDINNEIN